MISENREKSPSELNAQLRSIRHVRKSIYRQPNMKAFVTKLCEKTSTNGNRPTAFSMGGRRSSVTLGVDVYKKPLE